MYKIILGYYHDWKHKGHSKSHGIYLGERGGGGGKKVRVGKMGVNP